MAKDSGFRLTDLNRAKSTAFSILLILCYILANHIAIRFLIRIMISIYWLPHIPILFHILKTQRQELFQFFRLLRFLLPGIQLPTLLPGNQILEFMNCWSVILLQITIIKR